MEMIGCRVACRCGGHVELLDEGVYYILTENHTVIFRGICNRCEEGVRVERDILSLLLMCPTKEGEKGN